MATLERVKLTHEEESVSKSINEALSSTIPSPFPLQQLHRDHGQFTTGESSKDALDTEDPFSDERAAVAAPAEVGLQQANTTEIMPSIAHVQASCVMVLNNLLSASDRWNPIVPSRRHSMPSTPQSATFPSIDESSSALSTLVSNLRARDTGDAMTEASSSNTDSAMIREIGQRVDVLASSFSPTDALLAHNLVSLLSHFDRLSKIQCDIVTPESDHFRQNIMDDQAASSSSADVFDTLKRQLSDLQLERSSSQLELQSRPTSPVLAVEAALLWSRIDEELETVLSICKERTNSLHRLSLEQSPPQYYAGEFSNIEMLPEYDAESIMTRFSDTKDTAPLRRRESSFSNMSASGEKMRLDLESVTMAIDRLYIVAPQLHNQRVELKSKKLAQMEQARKSGSSSKGKEKERDVKELDGILELIGKATDRKMVDQSVVMNGGMKLRLERAKQRDAQKKEAFVEQLMQHSNAGRMHGQDAVFCRTKPPKDKGKDAEALLTLPEFIRETMSESSRPKSADLNAMMTLPEVLRESVPDEQKAGAGSPPASAPPPTAANRLKRGSSRRSRSLSSPNISWLRPSSSKANLHPSDGKKPGKRSRPGSSSSLATSPPVTAGASVRPDVRYVAEHHENLQHVLLFFIVSDGASGSELKVEVVPTMPNDGNGSSFVVTSGAKTSSPLILPVPVVSGTRNVRVQGEHYEVRLMTDHGPSTPTEPGVSLLMDATQLSDSKPTNFACASCSLPLLHSSTNQRYRDLPSEHWEELVDAWMCHADQKLHEHVMKSARGFLPEKDQALVGGSYILFEESAVVKTNLRSVEQANRGEDWQSVRCICGSVVGRCQRKTIDGSTTAVYRIAKYAVRPVSLTADSVKIPLSAFIVEDMMEFVHAHATHRFVVFDEEDEKPRILIWLFKPNIRMSYHSSRHYALLDSASLHAAKVLFKLLGPSVPSSDLKTLLSKYPGFPQAEYLYYPFAICHRLAGLLKESNRVYPEGMRTMTNLDVGFLQRA